MVSSNSAQHKDKISQHPLTNPATPYLESNEKLDRDRSHKSRLHWISARVQYYGSIIDPTAENEVALVTLVMTMITP